MDGKAYAVTCPWPKYSPYPWCECDPLLRHPPHKWDARPNLFNRFVMSLFNDLYIFNCSKRGSTDHGACLIRMEPWNPDPKSIRMNLPFRFVYHLPFHGEEQIVSRAIIISNPIVSAPFCFIKDSSPRRPLSPGLLFKQFQYVKEGIGLRFRWRSE